MEELIPQYDKYIRKIARKMCDNHNFEDLYQEGMLALILASRRFNENKGNPHKYYLTCIKYALIKFVNEDKIIRKPNNSKYKSHKNYNEKNDITIERRSLDNYVELGVEDTALDALYLWELVDKLDHDCREIIIMYYKQHKTLKEIGQEFNGVSKQAISVKLKKTLNKLRQLLSN